MILGFIDDRSGTSFKITYLPISMIWPILFNSGFRRPRFLPTENKEKQCSYTRQNFGHKVSNK